jgi:aspartyl-tRNA(Asn)/glutamyl-tRNA(Gln) amidotransferase subunit C
MSQFGQSEFNHLKRLCRIDCSEEEAQDVIHSLGRILTYVEQLDEVDTEGVASCNYVLRGMLKNQMREDSEGEPLARERFLANAPDQIGGMVRVPPIMKG